ncbi:MAG: cell division protein ZipA C-terminal FtsZ-binding domain-containing protein [Gammaproteobacteria bacterium]|nr:cell division protein ZipA C-terminal FtsZ-binding domain-containing protein [Gammaproteobacteria bacterium]
MEAISAFFTDPLRLTLGAAAVVVLLGIFVFGRKNNKETPEELSPEEIKDVLTRNEDNNVIVKDSPTLNDDSSSLEKLRNDQEHEIAVAEINTPESTVSGKKSAATSSTVERYVEQASQAKTEDMFVVLHVVAPEGMAFTGNAITHAMEECNLVYGDFKIFHYPHPQNDSLSLFSVVNMLKPGFFDADKMLDLTTTGISFFMRIPVMPGHHLDVFTTMLATAQAMSRKLGGSLLNEKHDLLTQMHVDTIKQKIEIFEDKLKSTEQHSS